MDAASLGIAAGAITAANEAIFAPLAGHGTPWQSFNWRIIPATGIFALGLYGLDKLSHTLAMGVGMAAIVTVLFTRTGNAPAPTENAAKALGYMK